MLFSGNRGVVKELLFTIVIYAIGSVIADGILGRFRRGNVSNSQFVAGLEG